MRNSWQGSPGARYRYFYEARIKQALKSQPISDIEVPVTLLWFPDLFGTDKAPHKAARKLFVDVNKEARKPSESRLILLSDSELLNILTRTTLTQLRNQAGEEYLPLYCVEYDNPGTKTTQSARWSALTNINALKEMVSRSVFGPGKYINKVDTPIGSREKEDGPEGRNTFMREQLAVDKLFPLVIDGPEPFSRDELGNRTFPESAVPALTQQYRVGWSSALLTLLSRIEPWAAHARALSQLKEKWLVDDAVATLAHDALFSGVGMYWTLRDSAAHWQGEGAGSQGKPDVVQAWDMIVDKQGEFESLRAEQLLGSRTRRDSANQVYQAMNTHACQLGIALTLATIFRRARVGDADVVSIACAMSDGVNRWMQSKTSGEYDRRLVLAKRGDETPKHALNVVNNMDTPRAVQFRYFWLEILASPQAVAELAGSVDEGRLKELRDDARRAYVAYVAGEKARALKTSNPALNEKQRKEKGLKDAEKEVRGALIRWFDITAAEADAWFTQAETATSTEMVDEQQGQEEDDVNSSLDQPFAASDDLAGSSGNSEEEDDGKGSGEADN